MPDARSRAAGAVHGEATRLPAGAEPPPELRVGSLEVGGEVLALFDWPVAPRLPALLSSAEREVAELALRGLSNDEIAQARGTSARTVANQLASVYRKLGIGSRLQLFALGAHRAPR